MALPACDGPFRGPGISEACAPLSLRSDDVLCLALRHFIHRDLMDGVDHLMEGVGWTPITAAYARRLRELNDQHGIWVDEPDLVRMVLDGPETAV
jgi:hypothetical protein